MTNKTTKRALFTSVMSLIICVVMLMGTTFAWFTDSVTSGRNTITAGNLDVELTHKNGDDVADDTALFTDVNGNPVLWEPGVCVYENFTVTNAGTLALKYAFSLNIFNEVTDGDKSLSDVIKVGYVAGGVDSTDTRAIVDSITEWHEIKDMADAGELYPAGNEDGLDTSKTTGVVLYWQPGANDNDYNMNNGKDIELNIEFGINLVATQLTYESDSFDEQYDEATKLPVVANVSSQSELNDAISGGADTIYLIGGTYKLPATTNNEITLIGNGDTVVDLSYATGQALSGTDVTLENLTVTGSNEDYTGLQHVGNVVYNNVVFNNSTNLYGESVTFNDCTFNLTSRYIWTYGAGVATFNNCTFYTEGKAILAYKETDAATYTVNINDCTFYATKAGYTGSGDHCAAVEIDSSLVGAYVVNFNGTNTVSTYFADLYRIKSQKDPSNVTINQNGTVVETDLVPVSDGLFKDSNGNFYVKSASGLEGLHAWYTDTTNASYNMRKEFWGKTYSLMADIDATGYTWKTVKTNMDSATYNGITFNGNGFTISNMTIDGNGMFTGATQGQNAGTDITVIKDLTLDNVTVTGGTHHNGAVWGEVIGSITLENVNVINSKVSGGCNVGGLVGRNSESHATIKFVDCSVKNTTVEATKVADYAGASAFLGNALHIGTSCSANVIFEGTNVADGNTLTTAEGMQGGGIYTTAEWGDATWESPTVVNDFTNYNSNN